MGERVMESERVTRFVASKKNMSVENRRVKRHEFMPSFAEGKSVLSMFRIGDLDDEQVWNIAREHIRRHVVGRGDIMAKAVYKIGLDFDADDTPPGHVNVVGWPDLKEEKIQLSIALERVARLVVHPESEAV